jgi:guanylate kinase
MLYTITGATGSGKTFVADALVKQGLFRGRIVTYTSRKPRKNEKDGVAYHFITEQGITEYFDRGDLGYRFDYCGNVYGAPISTIKQAIVFDKDPYNEDYVIVLDRYSAFKLREKYPEAVKCIYIEGGARGGSSLARRKGREEEDNKAGLFDRTGFDCVIRNDSTKKEFLENVSNYIYAQNAIRLLKSKESAAA